MQLEQRRRMKKITVEFLRTAKREFLGRTHQEKCIDTDKRETLTADAGAEEHF